MIEYITNFVLYFIVKVSKIDIYLSGPTVRIWRHAPGDIQQFSLPTARTNT